MPNKLTESQIREIFAESGKMTIREMMAYLENKYSGLYDKNLALQNAKELIKSMRDYIS